MSEVTTSIREALSAGLVFAEPYERDGVGLVAGARVSGAGAGGHGSQEGQEGEGGVFRVGGRPVGAFVVTGGRVRWKPAVDVNRLVVVLGAVLIALVASRAAVLRGRPRHSAAEEDTGQSPPPEPVDHPIPVPDPS